MLPANLSHQFDGAGKNTDCGNSDGHSGSPGTVDPDGMDSVELFAATSSLTGDRSADPEVSG